MNDGFNAAEFSAISIFYNFVESKLSQCFNYETDICIQSRALCLSLMDCVVIKSEKNKKKKEQKY